MFICICIVSFQSSKAGKTAAKPAAKPAATKAAPKAAPAAAKKATTSKASSAVSTFHTSHAHLFPKAARNFGIGRAIPPTRDLSRYVKWPRYIRIQRQRAILKKRLKVPPAINQFARALDKNQGKKTNWMSNWLIFKLMNRCNYNQPSSFNPLSTINSSSSIQIYQLAHHSSSIIAFLLSINFQLEFFVFFIPNLIQLMFISFCCWYTVDLFVFFVFV